MIKIEPFDKPLYKWYPNTLLTFSHNEEDTDVFINIKYKASVYTYENFILLVGAYEFENISKVRHKSKLFCKFLENDIVIYESNLKASIKDRIINRLKLKKTTLLKEEFIQHLMIYRKYTLEGSMTYIHDIVATFLHGGISITKLFADEELNLKYLPHFYQLVKEFPNL